MRIWPLHVTYIRVAAAQRTEFPDATVQQMQQSYFQQLLT